MRHNQVSQGLTLSFTCPFTQLEEIILSKLCVVLCVHLVNNPASDTHAVENGHIDDGGHSSIVDGLRAVRPHVRTLCQVDVAGRKTGRRQGQERIFNNSVFGRHKLFWNKLVMCFLTETNHQRCRNVDETVMAGFHQYLFLMSLYPAW